MNLQVELSWLGERLPGQTRCGAPAPAGAPPTAPRERRTLRVDLSWLGERLPDQIACEAPEPVGYREPLHAGPEPDRVQPRRHRPHAPQPPRRERGGSGGPVA